MVLGPRLSTGVLERIEVVPLPASRLMFVLSLRGGLVKTLVLECRVETSRRDLERIVGLLNERLAGLTLEEIRQTYASRLQDLQHEATGIVRLVLDRSGQLFSEPAVDRLRVGPAQHLMTQPEFQEPEGLRHLIELLEDENYVVHVLEADEVPATWAAGDVAVRVGTAAADAKMRNLSLVTAQYQVGGMTGRVGVLGPMRMDYPHVVALVESTAALISRLEELPGS